MRSALKQPDPERARPDYLDRPAVRKLFERILNRLKKQSAADRMNRVTELFSRKNFKELYDPKEPNDDLVLWELIKKCEKDGLILLEKKSGKKDPDQPEWTRYRLVFNNEYEKDLRRWLDRPLVSNEEREWRDAVERFRHCFSKPELLTRTLFSTLEKPFHQVISRLATIPEELAGRPMTAYQLSAKLFWGCSKILKDREQWLKELFDLPEGMLLDRPILVEVHFPSSVPKGVLMLENLDSYFSACDGVWPECKSFIIIYLQGFKGASNRIRNEGHARFHLFQTMESVSQPFDQFRRAWINEQPFPYPIYFLGDLDWSGLAIFRSLKSVFGELKPWKTGYGKMIQAREKSECHSPAMADKKGQKEIDSTGDDWLDENVLKPMKQTSLFVDQESIGTK